MDDEDETPELHWHPSKNRFSFVEYKPGLDPELGPKLRVAGKGFKIGGGISVGIWIIIIYLWMMLT